MTRGDRLISCSKDGLVKVWDLATQHCSQTISGYKAEVWSLDLDPSERRLVTGEPAGTCICKGTPLGNVCMCSANRSGNIPLPQYSPPHLQGPLIINC